MKRLAALAATLVVAAPALARAQVRKYEVKSGIVTFEAVEKVGKMELTSKVVVTFDEYGAKERRDTFKSGKLEESSFSDDTRMYKVIHASKTAWDTAAAAKGRGTELRFDWDEVSAQDKQAGRAKQLPGMTVAGKKCDAYQVATPSGLLKAAGAGKVLLFQEVESKVGGMATRSVTRATSFQENAAIPADTFKVPAGYQVKKM
jgi:hypothetical protein